MLKSCNAEVSKPQHRLRNVGVPRVNPRYLFRRLFVYLNTVESLGFQKFSVYGLGFRIQGLGFGAQGLGFGVWCLGFRVQDRTLALGEGGRRNPYPWGERGGVRSWDLASQHLIISIFQDFNISNISTFQHFSISTSQHLDIFNISTLKHFPMFQYFIISFTTQDLNILNISFFNISTLNSILKCINLMPNIPITNLPQSKPQVNEKQCKAERCKTM